MHSSLPESMTRDLRKGAISVVLLAPGDAANELAVGFTCIVFNLQSPNSYFTFLCAFVREKHGIGG